MIPSRFLLFVGLSAALATVLPGAPIAVSSTASKEYVRPVDAAGRPKPESYVFTQGQEFGGDTADGSLARTTFADIARTLAVNLAKQNYFPTKDAAAADLVIMVHWGTTRIYEDPEKQFNLEAAQSALSDFTAAQAANGMADPTALNQATGLLAASQDSTKDAIERNAILLGYARSLKEERRNMLATQAEITMTSELNEERYFVILMAYDNHVRAKEHKSKLLWITRLSVRSPGNNFTEALPTLALAGSEVFGHQVDDLVRVKTPGQHGSVRLGEMEVLGQVDDKAPPAKPPEK